MKIEPLRSQREPEHHSSVDAEVESAFAQLLGEIDPQDTDQRSAARDLTLGLDDVPASDNEESDNEAPLETGEMGEVLAETNPQKMPEGIAAERANPWFEAPRPLRSIFARAVDHTVHGSVARPTIPRQSVGGRTDSAPFPEAAGSGKAPPSDTDLALGSNDVLGATRTDTRFIPGPSLATPDLQAEPTDENAAPPMAATAAKTTEPEAPSAPATRTPLGAPMTVSLQLATLAHDVLRRVQTPDVPAPTFEATSAPKPLVVPTAAGQDAFIHIDHPDLGRIRLQLQIEERNLRVRAIAQSVAAAAALRDSEEDMRADVARHGVELARLRVDVEDRRQRGDD